MATTGQKTRSVEKTIEINAPTEVVWNALSDAQELVRWFPMQAELRGSDKMWVAWDDALQGEWALETVEPGRHYRTIWNAADEPGAEGMSGALVVDFYLESKGGRTRLRLVHSGFGFGEGWDDMYDSVNGGWNFELRGLKHYLENHMGEDRIAIVARAPLGALSPREAWKRVTKALDLPAKESGRYSASLDGETLEGTVALFKEGKQFAGVVDNWNSAMFRVENAEVCGASGSPEMWLFASTYGLGPDKAQAILEKMESVLERTLGGDVMTDIN